MSDLLLAISLFFLVLIFLLQVVLWRRLLRSEAASRDLALLQPRLERLEELIHNSERSVRDEFSRLRQELTGQNETFSAVSGQRLDLFRQALEGRFEHLSSATTQTVELLRNSLAASGGQLREQVGRELEALRNGLTQAAQHSRAETASSLRGVSDSVMRAVSGFITVQKTQLEEIRSTLELRLAAMSADNEKRLEQMRQTVDEKLHGTLDARLGESFKLVSERLELVHKGLGEMQSLASGVGDLKRVLTNVKTRGTWGEVQLGALLEQMLTSDQFGRNIATTGTAEHVEFAIKLPGREPGETCWLPVDAKYPTENYQRLIEVSEAGDADAVEQACRALESTLKTCARTISEKYLLPPRTTDFGILYLPTEGLYAEALRRPGLAEMIQREYRVILTGPNTFAAILNSLQMGFRTLAIQQRSSEVWEILRSVQTQFGKYAGVLADVKKKLQQATSTVEKAETRTRVLQRQLRGVETAPEDAQLPAFDVEDVVPPLPAPPAKG